MKRSTGVKARCDRLFSLIVRSELVCQSCGYRCPCPDAPTSHTPGCKLQCAHVVTRARSHTRCVEANAYSLCAGCHHHYTLHPVEWGRWVVGQMGDAAYDEIYRLSQSGTKVDWTAVEQTLKERAKELGI